MTDINKKNVLITGASGFIASILRPKLQNNNVTLLSRHELEVHKNEVWVESPDLLDPYAWRDLQLDGKYDYCLHLAEPVKINLTPEEVESIINSHGNFLSSAASMCKYIIYPMTAYIYDNRSNQAESVYLDIKTRVLEETYNRLPNLVYPIIHPIYDSGTNLKAIIDIEAKIPFVNTFCSFQATLPVLRVDELASTILNLNCDRPERVIDIYSSEKTIAELFHKSERKNLFVVSAVARCLLALMRWVPQIELLIIGRSLRERRNPFNQ
jgi:nucleoside-diphosphate-sugar epimerase